VLARSCYIVYRYQGLGRAKSRQEVSTQWMNSNEGCDIYRMHSRFRHLLPLLISLSQMTAVSWGQFHVVGFVGYTNGIIGTNHHTELGSSLGLWDNWKPSICSTFKILIVIFIISLRRCKCRLLLFHEILIVLLSFLCQLVLHGAKPGCHWFSCPFPCVLYTFLRSSQAHSDIYLH